MRGLEYLTLDGVCTLDLAKLQPLTELRELIVQTSKPPENLSALANLKQLETIVVRSRMAVNDQVLTEMAKLPHLKMLVLDFGYSFPFEPHVTQAGLAVLAGSPSLELVYAGGRPDQGEDIFPLTLAAARTRGKAGELRVPTVGSRGDAVLSVWPAGHGRWHAVVDAISQPHASADAGV